MMKENNFTTPQVLGGLGEMNSNGGTQYYQQDRVYDSRCLAMCHPANIPGGSYRYMTNCIIKEFDIPKEILNDNERQRRVYSNKGIAPTVLARTDQAKILILGMMDIKGSLEIARRVYSKDFLSPCLNAHASDTVPKILVNANE